MLKRFRELVYNAFTGADNKSLDIGRILWAKGVYFFFGLSVYSLYMGKDFSPTEWATGFGLVLAAGGAALGLKAGTEPKAPPHSKEQE